MSKVYKEAKKEVWLNLHHATVSGEKIYGWICFKYCLLIKIDPQAKY
jgi:hypothetical protein